MSSRSRLVLLFTVGVIGLPSLALAFFLTSAGITSSFDTARNSNAYNLYSLSNSKVTAAGGMPVNHGYSAFTNLAHSTGKYAFRVTENACLSAGNQGCGIGLAAAGQTDANYLGSTASSVGMFDTGQAYINGVAVSSGSPTFLPGNAVDVEVDRDAKTTSYSVNGGAFSATKTIAALSDFNLVPGVTFNDPGDAFTYDGTISFPGYPAWNSAPGIGGTGACAGVPNMFGLPCNPAVSDNFDGTTLNTSLWVIEWCNNCANDYTVGNGVLTLGGGAETVGVQCTGNCVPALPSYWEIRFQVPNANAMTSGGGAAIWQQSSLPRSTQLVPGHFNGSTATGKQLEIDQWETQFDGYHSESGAHAWDPIGGGPPYDVVEDGAFTCQIFNTTAGGGCGPNQGTADNGPANLSDGNYHTLGMHRFVNGSGRNQADFYHDGALYASLRIDDNTYNGLLTLAQTPIFYWSSNAANVIVNIDYVRIWH